MKKIEGGVTAAKGFVAGAMTCGIKPSGKPDLMIVSAERPVPWGGAFTKNTFCGAPVIVCRERLGKPVRAIVVNSGVSNAGTGEAGVVNARAMARVTAEAMGCREEEILVASTGVIGHPLPMEKITAGIKSLAPKLTPDGGSSAAQAIMTTDTVKKESAVELELSGGTVRIGGCAKGSGMIHPNMATMLVWITTDAVIDQPLLQAMVSRGVEKTFNCITVDGDTSTSDTLAVLASGASGVALATEKDQTLFEEALTTVFRDLAYAVIRDGEGATKFVLIRVEEAATFEEARSAAMAVATSNLFKCALFGGDPNWGRIACALGNSGAAFHQQDVTILLDDIPLLKKGSPTGRESEAAKRMKEHDLQFIIQLGAGNASAEVATSDLSYDYVKINAEYTT